MATPLKLTGIKDEKIIGLANVINIFLLGRQFYVLTRTINKLRNLNKSSLIPWNYFSNYCQISMFVSLCTWTIPRFLQRMAPAVLKVLCTFLKYALCHHACSKDHQEPPARQRGHCLDIINISRWDRWILISQWGSTLSDGTQLRKL